MLDRLRLIFFIPAIVILLLAIGLELGSSLLPGQFDSQLMRNQTKDSLNDSGLSEDDKNDLTNSMVQGAETSQKPPGIAISYMALLDGVWFYGVLLVTIGLIPQVESTLGRLQGLASFIVSIVVIIVAIILGLKAFAELMIMVSLFFSVPFGTIAYLAIWGFFPKDTAAAMLSISFLLKLVFTVLLVLAHQRFLQNKGLVILIIMSLLTCFIIGFLHGFVPGILCSISDAIAGIVVMVLVVIYAVPMFVGSVISVGKVIL